MSHRWLTGLMPLLAMFSAALSPAGCGGETHTDDLFNDTHGTGPDAGGAGAPTVDEVGDDSAGAGGADQSSGGGALSTGGVSRGGTGSGGTDRGGSAGAASGGRASGGAAAGGTGGTTTGGVGSGGTTTGGNGGAFGGTVGSGGGPLERIVPFQLWKGPGATTTGILFTSSSMQYGSAIDWGRGIVASLPPQPYWFGSDGSSPYALYFPSSGEGVNFLSDWQVYDATGEVLRYDAAMFRPDTENPWGLSADAHIVTLEVNDGRGSNSGVHFVATDVTILDGTDEVPMNPLAVMREAKVDFDQRVADADAQISSELAAARAKTSPPSTVTFSASQAQGLWPTWRTLSKELELTFVHRRDESWQAPAPSTALPNMAGAAPNPSVPILPPPRPSVVVYRYHTEYVVTYRFDASGGAIGKETHGPIGIVDPSTLVPK
jgi:hypothetical protein